MAFKKLDLSFLDGVRGSSAVFVLISHTRWLLWEGYSNGYIYHPQLYNQFDKFLMYFLTFFRYGRAAVMLFFVLSGFVIHLRYSAKLSENPATFKFDWIDYVFRRAKRIYPPLIFALILTFCIDNLGQYFHFPIYF